MASNQPVTYQTAKPIRELSIAATGRAWGDLIRQVQRGDRYSVEIVTKP